MTPDEIREAAAELEADRLADLASFVVAFHWRPNDYWRMTLAEREAILTEANRQNSKSTS